MVRINRPTGDHKGPHPTPHRSRPYYTAVRVVPVYNRGEGGWDVGWWTLVVARRVLPPPYYNTMPIPIFALLMMHRDVFSRVTIRVFSPSLRILANVAPFFL